MENIKFAIPDDLKQCIAFHGHLCPGLVYGYLIAKEAVNLLDLKRSADEEVVAVCENDSCAVDALQVLLGTTSGKGNLIIKDYGKNAYTILNRSNEKAFRFSRTDYYKYEGEYKDEFTLLEKAVSSGTAGEQEAWRHKLLKARDLISKPFGEIFLASEIECAMPPFAPLARSESCAKCGEMTMSTKMSADENGKLVCIPCSSEK